MAEESLSGDNPSTGLPPIIPPAAKGLRTPRAAAIAGIAFGILYAFSTFVLTIDSPPGVGPADFAEWYRTTAMTDITIVSLYLVPFAGIAFLWFIAVIRNRIGDREDRFFATVFLGSGLLFVAMFWAAGAEAASLVVADRTGAVRVPDAETYQTIRSLARAFFSLYATRAAAIFIVVTSTIALGTAAFPRWLVVLGYLIAVVQFLGVGVVEGAVLLFPAWVIILSVTILMGDIRVRRA